MLSAMLDLSSAWWPYWICIVVMGMFSQCVCLYRREWLSLPELSVVAPGRVLSPHWSVFIIIIDQSCHRTTGAVYVGAMCLFILHVFTSYEASNWCKVLRLYTRR